MTNPYLQKYCELIIKVGINLYKGQCVGIGFNLTNTDFAVKLAETAYKLGAKYVELIPVSNILKRVRLANTKDVNSLDFLPVYFTNRMYEMIANDWAFIRIDNLEEIDELKDADPEKLGILLKTEQITNSALSQAISKGKITWCIVAAPGPKWAAKVFNSENSDELTDRLSEKLIKILRLDKDDSVAEWKSLGEKLIQRSNLLSEMKLDKLIFTGPGTDLEIGLNIQSIWKAGLSKAQNGRYFLANIPTEEVFTTPDFRRTNGKVRVTKPVKVLENLLTGIWIEFKDGKVINCGADSNTDILEKYFNTDEGARYLGEVALVDKNSEVHKSGLIFNSILYDENAACHIALGRGIPLCFSNSDELNTPEEMKINGCNYSLVHTDFMIGSDEINVTGAKPDGNKVQIIKNGEFVI